MTKHFDPASAKQRLLQLVREKAYRDGIDITLASGKKSNFYINSKKVSLHPEGLWGDRQSKLKSGPPKPHHRDDPRPFAARRPASGSTKTTLSYSTESKRL